MAEWKKVIVSGSNISQLNNDAGYITAASVPAAQAFSTMSIGGVNIIADVASDTLTIASASGTGLYITPDAGADSITLGLSAIPNSSLANSSVDVVAGNGLTDGGAVSLGGSVTLNVAAGDYITVNANDIAVNTTTLTPVIWAASASYQGNIFTAITGDVTIDANGAATIANGVIENADIAANAAIDASKINFAGTTIVSGSSIASNAQGEVTLTTNGVAASAIDLGLSTTDSPEFVNLTLTGDLFVQGTTTTINTTDLLVEDKFIVLASGSANAGDAGIIVDRGGDANGNVAYGFDSATGRWGYQNGLVDTTNAITIGTNGNSAFAGYVFTEAAHTAAPTTGEFVQAGAIYAATNGDIFIYS
jgi:hypothetical protein